jgi:L-malate glycosyltransferase
MQDKSICFITNAYPDFASSCRGIFIKQMILFLKRSGYGISVVTPKIFRESALFEVRDGITIYRFPFFSGNRLLIEYSKIPYVRMFFYLLTGTCLGIYTVLKHRCSLIHAHWAIPTGLIGVWVGFLLRKPLIVTIHGSDHRMGTGGSGLVRRLFLHVCERAKHIMCVSEELKNNLEAKGIAGAKISVLPMGVDESFVESSKRRVAVQGNRQVTVLSNRKFLPIYNISLLIRAIPLVVRAEPNVQFIIAGDGPERELLEKQANDLKVGSSVRFLGWVRHEEMADLLLNAEIYVSTSLDDGTSVSLLEAMASGAFPIVTDIPSNREWIHNGENGFLVPTQDERGLADRIIEAIRNPELVEKMRGRNQEMIREKAYWGRNIYKIVEIYEHSLTGA